MTINSIVAALRADPLDRLDIEMPVSGQRERILRVERAFQRWRGRDPALPYSDWNKGYWLSADRRPANAETATRRLLTAAGYEARWVTPSGSSGFSFRLEPRLPAQDPAATAPLPAGARATLDAIDDECYRLIERRRADGQLLLHHGKPVTRGGCWDVVAWKNGRLWFVELKQVQDAWEDSLRTSQRLWLEAALRVGVPRGRFLVLEWRPV